MIYKNKLFQNIGGALLTITIAVIFLNIFYGTILKDPDSYFFSKGGDGLKSYFGSYYHLNHDNSYLHTTSMNYPYGDLVFYSDSQPLVSNTLKFINTLGFDYNFNIIGLINILMLFSIPFGALFLFLLLHRLKLPVLYSVIVAIIIAFMSPQLGRMGGHFSLSYLFFIPIYLYLLHIFFDTRKLYISIILGVISFIGLVTHAYFFAFFGFLSFFMLIVFGIQKKEFFPVLKVILPHFAIQIVIPFVLFQLFTIGIASDRTGYPWGFFATRSFPESVFLPIGKPYGKFFHFTYLKWEGIAYVGLVSTLVFLVGLYNYFKNIRKKGWFVFNENLFLNAALWASIIALLFSFAYPFQWDLKWLWNYMGPLKQFRASGRFNWLFFYIINITTYYILWNLHKRKKTKFTVFLLVIALAMGIYDSYLNVRKRENFLTNSIPEILDVENKLPQNNWINLLDTSQYQAILPLPYFHIGSEVYWIDANNETKRTAFAISWKTGLPISAVLLSRTPISQTIKNLAYYFEPLSEYRIIKEYPNKKSLLLLANKGCEFNNNEERFMQYAHLIEENEFYKAYNLPIDSIIKLNNEYRSNLISETTLITKSELNNFVVIDSSSFIFESFSNNIPELPFGISSLSLKAKKHNIILDTLLFRNINPIKISFWMEDMDKDLLPRSILKISTKIPNGQLQQKIRTTVFRHVKYVGDNGWGLIEVEYQPSVPNEFIRIEIWNNLVTRGKINIDNVLIRESNQNIYYNNNRFAFKNNRFVLKQN